MSDCLIRNCVPFDVNTAGVDTVCDVEIGNGVIKSISPCQHNGDVKIKPGTGINQVDAQVDAQGATLLPGLHDHHIHLVSLAASLYSLDCADLSTVAHFAAALQQENDTAQPAWLRVIRYHPEIAGDIDRHWLDQHIPDRPARVQHRGGRLWVLNSEALNELGLLVKHKPQNLPPGIEFNNGDATGRLYECDRWLRDQLGSRLPSLAPVSQLLASYGITGITDTTPHNGLQEWQHFQQAQQNGELLQRVRMMGSAELGGVVDTATLVRGEYKIHLLESQLPDMDALCENISNAHSAGRNVAFHCVTRTELVFALSCLETTGAVRGDRIEHASVTPPEQLQAIKQLGLRIVTQPHFIPERGDSYLRNVDREDQPWLYRLQGFIDAGVPLAAGSDAPFGKPDPWRSMQAATTRMTASAELMQAGESLTPEQALALYTSRAETPGYAVNRIQVGDRADCCLLDCPWSQAREALSSAHVRMTWSQGNIIYDAAEQAKGLNRARL